MLMTFLGAPSVHAHSPGEPSCSSVWAARSLSRLPGYEIPYVHLKRSLEKRHVKMCFRGDSPRAPGAWLAQRACSKDSVLPVDLRISCSFLTRPSMPMKVPPNPEDRVHTDLTLPRRITSVRCAHRLPLRPRILLCLKWSPRGSDVDEVSSWLVALFFLQNKNAPVPFAGFPCLEWCHRRGLHHPSPWRYHACSVYGQRISF